MDPSPPPARSLLGSAWTAVLRAPLATVGVYVVWLTFHAATRNAFGSGPMPGALFVAMLGSLTIPHALVSLATVEALAERPVLGAWKAGVGRLPVALVVSGATVAVSLVGLVFLIAPGVVLLLVLFVATPVALLEGRGPWDSVNRSATLTRGLRGNMFLALFALAALYVVQLCGVLIPVALVELLSAEGSDQGPLIRVFVPVAMIVIWSLTLAMSSALTGATYVAARRMRGEEMEPDPWGSRPPQEF